MKNGFVNIQIIGKEQLKESFEDLFLQSGANSKGEFLRILLENYINPDCGKILSEIEDEKKQLIENKEGDIEMLTQELSFYKDDIVLNRFFQKYNAKDYTYRNRENVIKKVKITSVKEIFTIIMDTIKEK